ncbi:hypothetical protein P153DRAFT_400611 [Dothidotthia symphoricarpi CBS 119687]|uniref:HAUS augmin-like complex subunit 3 N-terminal domain-containing protein n=1 Tax=Dothidotthia symphoricarpi CBS 119687 TaxID=1392245 RepID=A0A6A6A1Q4_9PLEO|nr:uncharacterized protein P153DRAFT_400611 [Dothidotthia symphoricarpi CBS 119687]KAF2125125.1 hypothetical protein P153DRAFT_400611 [Dothidotthia symphoricarpi CBS 119687]
MAEEQAAHHLLNVLEERCLNVDLDKVLLGFENGDTKNEAAAWVDEYLHEDTLLTKEELELYQTLQKKGLLHQYETDGEPTRPILDHDISSAIHSLQSSTAAIEEQCKVLEAQKSALVKLKALNKPNIDAEHAKNERRRKEGQEKARLDVTVDDVVTTITDQLTDIQREIDTDKSTMKSYLTERFTSDDQILSRLPGIVSQVLTEVEVSEDEKSIEQWCKAIIAFRTATIKARVGTVYMNSLSSYSPKDVPDVSEDELEEQKTALQAEMDELHSEIASVAEMVVEHELRKPLTEIKERGDRERTQARAAWLNYVLSTLNYMGKRLDTVTTQTKDIDEFQHAVTHINNEASKRMPDIHTEAKTPTRSRTGSGPLLSLTPGPKFKPAKFLELPVALQDALRHADISFIKNKIETLQDLLVKTQKERANQLQDHYTSTSTSTHEKLAERLSKADGDLRVILDVLYKHTSFQQVKLSNPDLEEELQRMAVELEEKDSELLEAEGSELSLSDPKVRAFIAKYGK